MNVRDFILGRGVDEDIGTLADAYLKEALAVNDEDERIAALSPAVRALVSSVLSSLRKAGRGQTWDPGGRVVIETRVEPRSPAEPGEAPPSWIAWLRNAGQARYWIPGTGPKLADQITADEWDRRANWLENQARGVLVEAERCRAAARYLRARGVTRGADLLNGQSQR